MSDLSHTITVSPNAFMRLFLWFWDAGGAKLNTCLLFWGTLGMVVLWPFRLIGALLMTIIRALPKPKPRTSSITLPPKATEPKGPSRGVRWLTRLAHGLSVFWFKFQTPLTWLFRIVIALAVIALVSYGIYLIVTAPIAVLLEALLVVGISVAAIIIAVGLLLAVELYKRKRRPKPFKAKRHTIRRIYRSVHDHTCANVVIEK